MITQSWRTSYSSVIGTSHLNQGLVCQDAGACRVLASKDGKEIFVAVVSDGAGSATMSDVGSAITVNFLMQEFEKLIREGCPSNIDKACILRLLGQVRSEIATQAEITGLSTRDYACTALGAIIGPENSVFFQIGDGAIVVSKNESQEYSPMFWPQHGEFANQTNFIVQDNYAETLDFINLKERFDKIALFTDGIERLILNFSSKTVHPPALTSIFEWLAKKEPTQSDSFCPALTAYLGSELINSRTDDDKTLIIATNISPVQ